MKEQIKWSALIRLPAIIAGLVMLLLNSAWAQSYEANCALFLGSEISEMSECKATILNATGGEGGNLINYQWANGRVTVTQNVEEFYTINGKDGETVGSRGIYDVCVKNTSDQTIFCTGAVKNVGPKAQSVAAHKTSRLYSKYSDWVEWPYCKVMGLDPHNGCFEMLMECENSSEDKQSISCPNLGVCTYKAKGELKSKGYCFVFRTFNSRFVYGLYRWENGNRIDVVEGNNKITMNEIPVTHKDLPTGTCFSTKNKREEFCFRQSENYRFDEELTDQSKLSGVWISEGTTCTNRLHPMDGSIAVIENTFHNKEPSLVLWYDDLISGRRAGIEGSTCDINSVTRNGEGSFSGNVVCRGEGEETSSDPEAKPPEYTITFKVKPNEELLIFLKGKKERYVQCQG